MEKNLLPCRVLLFLLLLTIFDASSKPTLPEVEVVAVNAILASLKMKFEWRDPFSSSDCNANDRVQCDCSFDENTSCRVIEIDLSNQDMHGPIAAEIGNLPYLRVLDLSRNKLNGSIPNSLAKLSNLSTIDLYDNNLEGPIPGFLGELRSLQILYLDDNNLEGPIPGFLGELKSLQFLSLSNNSFNGSIPPELGALPTLLGLDLSDNLLSGPIPLELGNISSLEDLDLSNNRLSGHLPHQLGNLRNLQYIVLFNNEFTGVLPPSFVELKNLSIFVISGNNFTGRIPDFIANWTNLEALFLADLTGIPGGERHFLFPNISGLVSLQSLTLRNCSLIGQIPEFIGQMPNLSYLDLSFNNLTGGIPTFVNHSELKYMYLRGNELNGSLPGWLTNLTDSYVDVSENFFMNLTVPPDNISQNLNLFACCSMENGDAKWQKSDYHCYNETPMYDQLYINCGGKETSNGTRYEADLHPYGSSTFFLSNNKSWGYSSMGSFLFADQGRYIVNRTCSISMDDGPLYESARISPISLKYYGFCLKNRTYTVRLHFAEIVLEADKMHTSKGKRVFDVEIQGKKVLGNFNIEEAAGGVNKGFTKEFNVSVNDTRLEIHLYWAGKGSIIGPSTYYGPLISAISVSAVSDNMSAPTKIRKLSAISIAGIVASALLIPILTLVCLWKIGCFGAKELHGEELKGIELLPGSFFNFRQIKAATQNFSSANKLGEGGFGSVYKGVLPNGTAIAVKQLSAKSKQGIHEFVNEVGTISALRHPNLVRLLGCCAEDNQLLLVYEFMENNSLHHALFGPDELRLRLSWPTRVKICLGIAKGLAFLHEESKLKIVHRDIKPTNILLDKDLNAKISDFGFAKLCEGEMTNVITKIAGTTGYMAPEYAMRGQLTGKADVYSFGVVTLEIVSGKNSTSYRPTDGSVFLLDLAYVLQEKENLIELIDPALGSDYSSEEAITILELAMLCTNPSPTLRPNMSEVVKILEGKSKITTTRVSAPNSIVDFAMAKAIAGLSQSTHSGSTSQEETSNANTSQAVSKEIETCGISADCTAEITM